MTTNSCFPAEGGDGQSTGLGAPPTSIPFEHRLFTKRELAEYLGVEERTIENWMKKRFLPFIRIGHTVRFKAAAVLHHLETHHQVKPLGNPTRGR